MAGKRSDGAQKDLDKNVKLFLGKAKRKDGVTPTELMEAIGVKKNGDYAYVSALRAAKKAGMKRVGAGRSTTYHAK